jgi:hypothetical protein
MMNVFFFSMYCRVVAKSFGKRMASSGEMAGADIF